MVMLIDVQVYAYIVSQLLLSLIFNFGVTSALLATSFDGWSRGQKDEQQNNREHSD